MKSTDANSTVDELKFNTPPNMLTLIRIGFVPFVVWMLFVRDPFWDIMAAAVFGLASITDYFDGYLARTRKEITIYGKLLDPLADKFLVVSSLIALQDLGRIHPIVVMLLVCREMAITGLRALASAEGVIIPASGSAKWKTALQMIAIPFLMIDQNPLGIPFFKIGTVLLYLSLTMSLWSAKDYAVDFFKAIRELRKNRKAAKLARKEETRKNSDSGKSR